MTPAAWAAVATRGGERGIRLPRDRVDELDRDHRAAAAHLGDARVGVAQGAELLEAGCAPISRARSTRPSCSYVSIVASAATQASGLPP